MLYPLAQVRRADPVVICRALLATAAIDGLTTLAWTLSDPSDPDSRVFLLYSFPRWLMIALLAALTVGGIWLLFQARGNTTPIARWSVRSAGAGALTALSAPILLAALVAYHLLVLIIRVQEPGLLKAVFDQLLPLRVYSVSLIALALVLALLRHGQSPKLSSRSLLCFMLLWAILILLAGLILLTRFSLVPSTNGWYEYGLPLVSQQVIELFYLAVLLLIGAGLLRQQPDAHFGAAWKPPKILWDGLLALAIGVCAVTLWSARPIPETWMTPRTYPPNEEIYPFSDAMQYDSAALGILYGTVWARSEIHYKPLFVTMLAVMHGTVGNSYPRLVLAQTVLLALFPVLLYTLGKTLHSRLAGLLAAAAGILRELNQLSVASIATLSTSKLLLSELPSALVMAAILCVLARWYKTGKHNAFLLVLAGGMAGLVVQIRLQTIVLLPTLVLWLIFCQRRKWKTALIASSLACLGFAASVTPIILRNQRVSGTLALEKPGYFERTMAYAYSPTGSTIAPSGPDLPEAKVATQALATRVSIIASHFVHNAVSAILVLPSGLGARPAWTTVADLQARFWLVDQAPVTAPVGLSLALNLAVIALGAAALWERSRWASLLPAAFFAAYDLSSALAGFSGQRFILPVDWVGYFYFFGGLAWLSAGLLAPLGWAAAGSGSFWLGDAVHSQPEENVPPERAVRSRHGHPGRFFRTGAALVFFVCAGGLLPALEAIIPVRYPGMSAQTARVELTQLAEKSLSGERQADFLALLDQPDVEVLHGIALYPRAIDSLEAAEGIMKSAGETTYPVLSFLYIGDRQVAVLQPVGSTSGIVLPNGAEVLVAGRQSEQRFEAFATARLDPSGLIFLPSGQSD